MTDLHHRDPIPDATEESPATGGVAAVDRALSILMALEKEKASRTLSELSRATGLYKSTILRLLNSLIEAGFVLRVEDSKYALGPMIMQLGMAYEQANPLRHHILPILERLVEAGTESPSFHIRQNASERLCLFRLDSNHATLDRVHAGDRLPLRRGAAGKVLLAFDNEPGSEFDIIRKTFFALSAGERDQSCAGIAMPVFGAHGRIIGALSLSGPRERFTELNIAWMRGVLQDAVAELSRALGWTYPQVEI